MKYAKEIEEMLDLVLGEDKDNEDFQTLIDIVRKQSVKQIETGIQNGYSVEEQMELIRKLVEHKAENK